MYFKKWEEHSGEKNRKKKKNKGNFGKRERQREKGGKVGKKETQGEIGGKGGNIFCLLYIGWVYIILIEYLPLGKPILQSIP